MKNLKPIDIAKNITKYGFLESFDGGEHTFLEEAKEDGTKEFYVTGQFLRKNFESKNKVFYTADVVNKFVEQINSAENDIVMWVTHFPVNEMRETAAKVVEAWADDTWGYYKAKLLDTTAGKDIKVLLQEGLVKQVSVRYFPIDWEEDTKTGVANLLDGTLKGIDYVSSAGVVGASARLTESDKETLNVFLESVDNKLLEKGIREVFSMEDKKKDTNLEESRGELALETANTKIAELEKANKELVESKKVLTKSIKKIKEEIVDLIENFIKNTKATNIESISELTKTESVKKRIQASIESVKFEIKDEQTLVEAYNAYKTNIETEANNWKSLIEEVRKGFEPEEKKENKEEHDGDEVSTESVKDIKKSVYESLDNKLIMDNI